MRLLAHDDSWCPRCKAWTLGPNCHWCGGTQTTRYSPAVESARAAQYRRLRHTGAEHDEALELLDLAAQLVDRDHATNEQMVRDLLAAGRQDVALEHPGRRAALRVQMPAAVAA